MLGSKMLSIEALLLMFVMCLDICLQCPTDMGLYVDPISKAFSDYCYKSLVATRTRREDLEVGTTRQAKIDSKVFQKNRTAISAPFKSGNQSYQLTFLENSLDSDIPLANITNRVAAPLIFDPDQKQNGTKEGKFLFPIPFGIYEYSINQPLPLGSLFVLAGLVIIPFVPFGAVEFTLALAWDANYIAYRLNGNPDNSGITTGRTFEDDQFDLYSYIENFLSNTFALDGKSCVQRLICELAEVPIREQNMVGEALHFIMDPRRGKTSKLEDYVDAETQGMTYGNCGEVYGECPVSIRNYMPRKFVQSALKSRRTNKI